MEKMKVVLEKWALSPTRAHRTDAGLDLYAPIRRYLRAHDSVVIDTGVHVELPPGTVGMLKSKSGLNVYHGLTGEGVIDEGYTGTITVKLYNNSGSPYIIQAGDKISQLVILPVICPEIEIVDSLADTERGAAGFGSTGR